MACPQRNQTDRHQDKDRDKEVLVVRACSNKESNCIALWTLRSTRVVMKRAARLATKSNGRVIKG